MILWRAKVENLLVGDKNFAQRIVSSDKSFASLTTYINKILSKSDKFLAWWRKFCSTNNFIRQKLPLTNICKKRYYLKNYHSIFWYLDSVLKLCPEFEHFSLNADPILDICGENSKSTPYFQMLLLLFRKYNFALLGHTVKSQI